MKEEKGSLELHGSIWTVQMEPTEYPKSSSDKSFLLGVGRRRVHKGRTL